jgi:pimeloyl-ACP methyl ester carboxylesterase
VLATKHTLAQQHGVRIISPDRPGFGGTTDVPPADRVRVWLDIVEALLQHLAIRHVSLVGYSGGTIYAMNVLLHLRHLLHPTHPYVALCAPWVHPSHSGVSLLKLAGLLPNGLVGSFDRLIQFAGIISPALHSSSVLAELLPLPSRESDYHAPGVDPEAVALEENLSAEIFRRVTHNNVQGISKDALLLLKRDEYPGCWGTWGDYDTLVPLLAQAERGRRTIDSSTTSPLKVQVFFAESDRMIGTTVAPDWFNNCWRSEQRGDGIDYSSSTIPKTTHDNIADLRYGVFQRIFQELTN